MSLQENMKELGATINWDEVETGSSFLQNPGIYKAMITNIEFKQPDGGKPRFEITFTSMELNESIRKNYFLTPKALTFIKQLWGALSDKPVPNTLDGVFHVIQTKAMNNIPLVITVKVQKDNPKYLEVAGTSKYKDGFKDVINERPEVAEAPAPVAQMTSVASVDFDIDDLDI